MGCEAFGRKLFPMEAHTEGEKSYTPKGLESILGMTGFNVERCFTLFFFAFPVARLFKIARIHPHNIIIKIMSLLENFMEKFPGIRLLNSTIVVVGTKKR